MSRGWLKALAETPALASEVEVVGLVDIDRGVAEARAAEAGLTGVHIGTDLEAALISLKPDLLFDVVIPAARRNVVAAGLAHGCHVLTEKPMAASMDEARELVQLAAKAGRVHAVIQNRRFIPGVRRIKRLIDSGAIGEVVSLNCDFFIGAHFGGFRDAMQHPLLLDMAIHTLDAARFMSGKVPLAVYCLETNPKNSWYAQGGAANAVFELSDGVVFNYRGSWCAEGANTSWESAWRIVGTRGTLLWDGFDNFEAKVVASDSGFLRELKPIEVPPPADEAQTHGHASVIAEFIAAIREGRAPETVSSDNIKSLAMVFGAIASAEQQARVEISI
jgi:predicted dehydrogenase